MPGALFLFGLLKMAPHSRISWPSFPLVIHQQQSPGRVKHVEFSTYPLLTSMISPLEVQDELLPHRLVSKRVEEREAWG